MLDEQRIAYFRDQLTLGVRPTAIAVSVLDIKQYYDSDVAHWCLAHYLLDGHHKIAAAAETGCPITLLSFVTSDHGISAPENIDKLLNRYN